ncbi:MAG: tRNA lysidine(34) synthetase TilS [Rhodocyclaceae bacterium]|nr:tRNA lysidine(34) synthetase TilS [Rhodocyclaceae bacterium]MBL0076474.1 tRNA lysidine(34) synthetase TilS [Rhodocyclaceae bacterium]MBP6110694.1 tRNA lysidine(34) synthetase TilS [Rhodocyclaceae bacterium]MBP6278879.1 tRNA lysidine(34) synthetase TilS [Rhodocyclaceae bacterium]
MANSRKSNSIEVVTRSLDDFLLRHVAPGQRVAIAYSGGLDSTVLLHSAASLCASRHLVLSTIHINHGLSPNAAVWATHCAGQAALLDIPHTTVSVDVPRSSAEGLEAAARHQRYAVFAELPVDWIALAHHLDDQAETLMHNLLRGTGVRGMAGMLPVRANYLRPLLGISRQQLLEYAQHYELTWCGDESNDDLHYTRNYIRHAVMPVLEARYPSVTAQLAATAARFADTQNLLEDLARVDAGDTPLSFPFPVAVITALQPSRACNLLRCLLANNQLQAPSHVRLAEFVRQVREAGPDRHPQLDFGGCTLRVKNRQILLEQMTA